MALAAGIVNFVVGAGGGDASHAALGAGMAISAVRGQGYPEGMINLAVRDGKDPMAVVTASTAALTDGDGHQNTSGPVTGGATAVLFRRTT